MSKKCFVCALAGAALLLTGAIVVGALDRRAEAREADGIRYDLRSERVYEGTVGSKGHVVNGLMYFALKTSDSTVEVQIGPEEFVERSGFKLKIGAWVTATGMPQAWNGRNIVLAREVRDMTSVLVVRDGRGYPSWDVNRPIDMDPELQESDLCSLIK